MRVLMVAQFYAPIVGGEEQHVRDLSQWLAEQGHDVSVATLWHRGLAEFERDDAVRVHRIRSTVGTAGILFADPERHHAIPFPDPGAMRRLWHVIERERPEIVHAHNWLVHSFVPLKRWSGAGLVMTLHEYSLACVQKHLRYRDAASCSGPALAKCLRCAWTHYGAKGPAVVIGNWTSGKAVRRAVDRFIAVSQAVVDGTGLANSGARYEVIPNFVYERPNGRDEEAAQWLSGLPDEPFLMFAGDVVPAKGVNTLLDAYQRIDGAPPLVLIGRLTSQSPAYLPRNVHMIGRTPHHAVMEAWRRSLMAIVPSECVEAFGLVALEAMRAGRPVIASRTGGLSDLIVDGESGFLVPPGDPAALSLAIRRLLSDAELRQRIGDRARARAEEFAADRVGPRIVRVYEDVIDGARSGSVSGRHG